MNCLNRPDRPRRLVRSRITLAVLRMLRSQGLFADRMAIRFKIEEIVETLGEVSLSVVVKDRPVEVLPSEAKVTVREKGCAGLLRYSRVCGI